MSNFVKTYTHCRICCNEPLVDIVSYGDHSIHGAFETINNPIAPTSKVDLTVCFCNQCGALQLKRTVDPEILYSSYFYQSSITQTMKKNLDDVVDKSYRLFLDGKKLYETTPKEKTLRWLDIACNDGYLLKQVDKTLSHYYSDSYILSGIDPSNITAELERTKPSSSYKIHNDTFENWQAPNRQIYNIITSIAMFYDVDDPVGFVRKISKNLDLDGIWVCEFAYLLDILENNIIDTFCQEHIFYYSLSTFQNLLAYEGMEIIKVERNKINGGSLRVYCAHKGRRYIQPEDKKYITQLKVAEFNAGIDKEDTYHRFFNVTIRDVLKDLRSTILSYKPGEVMIYGMSTKMNVLLELLDLPKGQIEYAAERTPEKIGGKSLTGIKMISEEEARARCKVFLVGPYFFKDEILKREEAWLMNGGKFIFPLPTPLIMDAHGAIIPKK